MNPDETTRTVLTPEEARTAEQTQDNRADFATLAGGETGNTTPVPDELERLQATANEMNLEAAMSHGDTRPDRTEGTDPRGERVETSMGRFEWREHG